MSRWSGSIIVEKPRSQVAAFLLDPWTVSKWQPRARIVSALQSEGLPRYHTQIVLGQMVVDGVMEIDPSGAPAHISGFAAYEGASMRYVYELAEVGPDRTRLTLAQESRQSGRFAWLGDALTRLVEMFAAPRGLRRLKQAIETTALPPDGATG